MKTAIRFVTVALGATLGACSSGASMQTPHAAPLGSSPNATAKTASATISIVVPQRTHASSARRSPAYVSPNTESFVIEVVSNDGTAIVDPPSTTVNVGPTSANCKSSATALTCTASIDAPVGKDVLSVAAWSGGNGSGAELSENTNVAATISATAANLIPLTMNAVAAYVSVATSTVNGNLATQPAPGAAATIKVSVTAKDCTGATIVGPGSYVDPIKLTLTEVPSLGATKLSETTVNAPTDTVTLSWTGSAATQYASIAPYVADYEAGCNDAFNYLTTGYFLPHPEPPYVWTSQISNSGAVGEYGWLVGYPTSWIHGASAGATTMRPGVTIESPGIGFFEVSADTAGDVFTLNQNASGGGSDPTSYEYAAGATFDATPKVIGPGVLQPPNASTANPTNLIGLQADPTGTLFELFPAYLPQSSGPDSAGIASLAAPYTSASTVFSDVAPNAWPYNGYNAPGPVFVDKKDDVIVGFEPVANPSVPSFIGVFAGGTGHYVFPTGDPAIGGVWSDGTTVYAFVNGNGADSIISYSLAGIVAGTATESTVFSTTLLTTVGQSNNQLVRDASGYYYVAAYDTMYAFAPGSAGASAKPAVSFTNAFDPTTSSNAMVVPSGLVAPGNGIEGIGVQP